MESTPLSPHPTHHLVKESLRKEYSALGVALFFSLLFLLMLPYHRLTGADPLFRLIRGQDLPPALLRAINLTENLILAAIAVILLVLLISLFWYRLRANVAVEPVKRTGSWIALRTLLYALPCLLVWSLYLYAFWPGLLSSDTFAQWAMTENLATLTDWHPVGSTLLLYAITRLWNHPAILPIFQIACMALLWGTAMTFFERRGVNPAGLALLTAVFSLLPYNGIMMVTLWKDIPYAIANFALVFVLGIVWYTRGRWLSSWLHTLELGLLIGLPYLLRYNGMVFLALIPLGLLISYPRQWRNTLVAAFLAITLVFAIRDVLGYGILKAEKTAQGVEYEVPIQHISAVIHAGGEVRWEEQEILQRITTMAIWKDSYVRFSADAISKPWGATHDPEIVTKIDQNGADLMRVFFALALRYPRVVVRSELDLTSIVWEFSEPRGYSDYALNYLTASFDDAPRSIPDMQRFAQPNLDSPITAGIKQYLAFSSGSLLTKALFWRGGLYLWLTLLLAAIFLYLRGADGLILFVPALANVISLAASIPGPNFRFVYPYILPVFLLLLFTWVVRPEPQSAD